MSKEVSGSPKSKAEKSDFVSKNGLDWAEKLGEDATIHIIGYTADSHHILLLKWCLVSKYFRNLILERVPDSIQLIWCKLSYRLWPTLVLPNFKQSNDTFHAWHILFKHRLFNNANRKNPIIPIENCDFYLQTLNRVDHNLVIFFLNKLIPLQK